MTAAGFINQGSYKPEDLIAGEFPRVTKKVTLAAGSTYVVGEVIGDDGSDWSRADGDTSPAAVLAESVDATAGAVEAIAYFSGEFKGEKLVFASALDATIEATLRPLGIFIHGTVAGV